ncbi:MULTISPECIES: sigma-70 family RNA polymerase sigma factor [unclassified Agarivorans]|uniref:sigma-70 family RNA polymerase sigma factor n=1 Tax=unclassified Agarivorans TaxID=2636026 RepID=UPI0026E1698D|nr:MULTISPECIES: sigma-70 family RNA polymerase sigma factor [unclassified Agarivorans]MDO6684349.1 sigma-70 family RNA polymerase sigma factor [Agarivorans sp. 3_MG-2023]MDO6714514.1 sigma-70 family RNA polymerase sigma factor [Agarivorans sp. 2_MG-2023]
MSPVSDEQLMLDYGQRGNLAAFDQLYQRYRQPLFAFIRQKMPEAACNEVFQEVWEAIITQAESYQLPVQDNACEVPTRHFRGFLYTIARRRIADYWRAKDRKTDDAEQNFDELASPSSPETEHQQGVDKQIILRCVSLLPQKQQEVFSLKQSGLALAEMSQVLDASFDAIKSRLRVAYQQLRECWEKHHG